MPFQSQLRSADIRKANPIPRGKRIPCGWLALGLLALTVTAVSPAYAWNDQGHMAVAYLAYRQLNPVIRARTDALLKLNPYYAKWLAAIPKDTPPGDVNRMIFMIAATWPDQIRSDPDYRDDGSNGGNAPSGPEAAQNIGYQDHLRHKYWHFIDMPFSEDGTALPPVPAPNAETQIAAFRATLGSAKSDDVKSYDLTWLEHLVGDIHQPLHAVERVTASLPNGDAGGNRVLLCSAPCSDNLHLFWDRLVGSESARQSPPPRRPDTTAAALAAAAQAAMMLPRANTRLAMVSDEAAWVRESFAGAKKYAYAPPIGPGEGPYTITQSYFEAARKVAEERVALAAARLANLLNRELK